MGDLDLGFNPKVERGFFFKSPVNTKHKDYRISPCVLFKIKKSHLN